MTDDRSADAAGTADAAAIADRHRRAIEDHVRVEPERFYVDGEWVESEGSETYTSTDPATGQALLTVPLATAADVDRAVRAARAAFESDWRDRSPADRQAVVDAIRETVADNRERLATLESLDTGKTIAEARGDVDGVVEDLQYFASVARGFEGRTVPTSPDKRITTTREPYGVAGLVVPWNFPLGIATWKLAPALAAGNGVVVKPAEATPLSTLELVRLLDDRDAVPDGLINVVTGRGSVAGHALTTHPDVPKVSFTGSTETGRTVMRDAAEQITELTLELGGKNPLVVFPDADVDRAASVATMASFNNAGENCTATSRLFVHADVAGAFCDALVAETEALTVGDPLSEATDVGPKVGRAERDETLAYLEDARESGATVLTGGGVPDEEALSAGAFVSPTVLTGLDDDHPVACEEIFGPVTLVSEWRDYDEMVDRVNDSPFGLSAGIFASDVDDVHRTARDLETGTIWVNQYLDFTPGLPFGGYGQSGIGRETAQETLEQYTRTKAVDVAVDPGE
jgi:aldehyde dehydrogenase (NAD+)